MESAGERLKYLRRKAGYEKAVDFARAYGISDVTYRAHENGGRGLKLGVAERYAALFRVSLNWLLTGKGDTPEEVAPQPPPEEPTYGGMAEDAASYQPQPKTSTILEIDVRGGLGGGGEGLMVAAADEHGNGIAADDVKAVWNLPSEYVRHELRVHPKSARLIEVRGDSMSPTLESGDRVMIDAADRVPSPGGVFAIWDGLGVVVKRLEHIPNSDPPMLKLISDNQRHGEYERSLDEVNVIGRVIWFARRL